MKRWSPIAFPGPGDSHRNFNQTTGERGSWLDGDGYQQIIDELTNVVLLSGLTASEADSEQVAKAIRSQALNFIPTIGGTANALTATLDPEPADWDELIGTPFRFVVSSNNSGASTLGITGLAGAKDIVYPGDNSPMLDGELRVGAIRTGLYDGTRVQLIDAGSRARAGVAFRGAALFTASGTFDPAALGLTALDRILIFCWGGAAAAQRPSAPPVHPAREVGSRSKAWTARPRL